MSTLGWDPGAQWEAALEKACPGKLTSGGAGTRTQVSASLSCSPHCFPVSGEKFPEHLLWSNSSSDAYRGLSSVWCGAHWRMPVGSLISLCGINSPRKETEAEKMLHRNQEQSQGLNPSALAPERASQPTPSSTILHRAIPEQYGFTPCLIHTSQENFIYKRYKSTHVTIKINTRERKLQRDISKH